MRLPGSHGWMGAYVITLTAGMDYLVFLKGLPSGIDGNAMMFVLGAWNGLCGTVVNWAFGSTSQSVRQSELLAAATPAAAQPNVAEAATRATETKS